MSGSTKTVSLYGAGWAIASTRRKNIRPCKEQTAGNIYGKAMANEDLVVRTVMHRINLYGRAASKEKQIIISPRISHYQIYDKPQDVQLALAEVLPFLKK